MWDLKEDVLSNTDIIDIIGRYVELKKTGSNFVGLCPFHKEKTPSFTVSADKQIFKCFGCWAWGDVITFLMEIEKIDFVDALKILGKEANLDIQAYESNNFNKDTNAKETIKLVNKYAQEFFRKKFEESSQARNYVFENRKLSEEVVNKFGIGYAPDNYLELVDYLKSKNFTMDDLIKSWLVKKWATSDPYSFFRNRVMFPIYDHIGNLVAFAWRSINENDQPKYLNIPETILYNKSKILYWLDKLKENIRDQNQIIVVEWYMDVIGLWRAWKKNWVAPCWTAFTQYHFSLLKRYQENIVFAFDSDEAWIEGLIRATSSAFSVWVFPRVILLPEWYKDIDEYVNNSDQNIDFDTIDAFDYILEYYTKKYDITSPNWRNSVISGIFELLKNIENINFSVFEFYIGKLSSALNSNFSFILNQFRSQMKKNTLSEKKENDKNFSAMSVDNSFYLAALFYQNFLYNNDLWNDKIKSYSNFFKDLVEYFPESFLKKVYNQEIENTQVQKIKEAQLWWENQFAKLKQEKKEEEVINFLKKQLHTISSKVLKSKKISNKDKEKIYSNIKSLLN